MGNYFDKFLKDATKEEVESLLKCAEEIMYQDSYDMDSVIKIAEVIIDEFSQNNIIINDDEIDKLAEISILLNKFGNIEIDQNDNKQQIIKFYKEFLGVYLSGEGGKSRILFDDVWESLKSKVEMVESQEHGQHLINMAIEKITDDMQVLSVNVDELYRSPEIRNKFFEIAIEYKDGFQDLPFYYEEDLKRDMISQAHIVIQNIERDLRDEIKNITNEMSQLYSTPIKPITIGNKTYRTVGDAIKGAEESGDASKAEYLKKSLYSMPIQRDKFLPNPRKKTTKPIKYDTIGKSLAKLRLKKSKLNKHLDVVKYKAKKSIDKELLSKSKDQIIQELSSILSYFKTGPFLEDMDYGEKFDYFLNNPIISKTDDGMYFIQGGPELQKQQIELIHDSVLNRVSDQLDYLKTLENNYPIIQQTIKRNFSLFESYYFEYLDSINVSEDTYRSAIKSEDENSEESTLRSAALELLSALQSFYRGIKIVLSEITKDSKKKKERDVTKDKLIDILTTSSQFSFGKKFTVTMWGDSHNPTYYDWDDFRTQKDIESGAPTVKEKVNRSRRDSYLSIMYNLKKNVGNIYKDIKDNLSKIENGIAVSVGERGVSTHQDLNTVDMSVQEKERSNLRKQLLEKRQEIENLNNEKSRIESEPDPDKNRIIEITDKLSVLDSETSDILKRIKILTEEMAENKRKYEEYTMEKKQKSRSNVVTKDQTSEDDINDQTSEDDINE